MRRYLIVLGVATLLSGLPAQAQDRPAGHEPAVAAIRKLGGEVKVDATRPGQPTAVFLTGAGGFGQCLAQLKELNNLQTCDL